MIPSEEDFERWLAEALEPGEIHFTERQRENLLAAFSAASSTTADDAELEARWLAEALEPGEICFTEQQRENLLAAFSAASSATAGDAELEEFTTILAGELDPGELAFEDEERRALVQQMAVAAAGENLTAWALDEMPASEREGLEHRLAISASLREEALAFRRFCMQLTETLPEEARPGWLRRTHMRLWVFPKTRRPLWLSAAAAAVVLLAVMPWQPSSDPVAVVAERLRSPAPDDVAPPPPRAELPTAELPTAEPTASREVALGTRVLPRADFAAGALLPGSVPADQAVPPFRFGEAPAWPGIVPTSRPAPLLETPEVVAIDGIQHPLRSQSAAGPAMVSPPVVERGAGLGDLLIGNNSGLARQGTGGGGVLPGGQPPAVPEPTSVSLANLQPYVLPGLLGGAASGRPDMPVGEGNRWLMAADFRLLDLSLASGSGLDAESWSAAAGMIWQISPAWQAGLSVGGIDARLDVPGFGKVDVDGVSFGGSLEWRDNGYHASLAYDVGLFDQELHRQAFGMEFPADQDATVHRLSFWFTREFDVGCWKHGPVVGFEGTWGDLDAYQESLGGGVTMAGRDFTALTTLVGWQAWATLDSPVGPWMPHVVAGWRHRPVVPDSEIIQGTPDAQFVLPPLVPDRDSLLLEGGLRWLPGDGSVFLDVISSGEWSDGGELEKQLLLKLGVAF